MDRLLGVREADVAQLQHELLSAHRAERSVPSALATHHGYTGLQHGKWQMSISEAAANECVEEPSDAALERLLKDKRKLQVVPCYLLTTKCHCARLQHQTDRRQVVPVP